MAQQVQLPNGQIVEFPDGTSREVMANAIKTNFNFDQPKKSFLEKAGDFADKYINKPIESLRIPEIAGGFLQGSIQGAESIANLPLMGISKLTGKDVTLPYVNLQKYARQDPASRAAFFGGEVGGALLPGAAAYKGAQGALGKVLNPSLAREAIAGATAGGAVSGGEDESNRILGAALGGAIPLTLGLTSKKIASNVVKKQQQLDKYFNKKYDSIFGRIKDAGLSNQDLRIPQSLKGESGKKLVKDLASGNRDYQKTLNKFIDNPNFENAHKAQSDLRKFSSFLQGQIDTAARTGKPVSEEKFARIKLAGNLRDRVRGAMQQFLLDNNKGDILKDYGAITSQYRQLMVPYLNPATARYEQGLTRPTDFVKELLNQEKFTKPGGAYKQIPGLGTRRVLNKTPAGALLEKALQGAALSTGAGAAYQLGLPSIGRILNKASD